MGETKGEVLNVNGVIDADGNRSIINFKENLGFQIAEEKELNIFNVNLENASSIISNINENTVINLTNVNIKNNAVGIVSNGDVNLTADGANVEISGNENNAIYLDNLNKTLSINLKNGGSVT